MNKLYSSIQILSLIIASFFLASCSSHKNIAYFKDLENVKSAQLKNIATFTEPTIQKDDILSINIFTLNPENGTVVNQAATIPSYRGSGSSNSTAISEQSTGFIVDRNGEIELSIIGKLKVLGLTTYQAKELIRERVSKNYKEPNIQLRFANFKVAVMGEVTNPSTYTMPSEKVTILDALSIAGDLTIYGKRENVIVLRDHDGVREYGRLDLNSSELFNSPYYYLKQNDVIYVEPNKRKANSTDATRIQTVGVLASILSVIVIAIANFK